MTIQSGNFTLAKNFNRGEISRVQKLEVFRMEHNVLSVTVFKPKFLVRKSPEFKVAKFSISEKKYVNKTFIQSS